MAPKNVTSCCFSVIWRSSVNDGQYYEKIRSAFVMAKTRTSFPEPIVALASQSPHPKELCTQATSGTSKISSGDPVALHAHPILEPERVAQPSADCNGRPLEISPLVILAALEAVRILHQSDFKHKQHKLYGQ
ncbi:hypothetical protein E2320_007206, partial [Naja naja]